MIVRQQAATGLGNLLGRYFGKRPQLRGVIEKQLEQILKFNGGTRGV